MPKRQRAPASPAESTDRGPPAASFPASARHALIILTVIACGAVLWVAQDFLIPTAAAIVLALILAPIVKLFERLGLPNTAASFLVVMGAGGLIVGSAFIIAPEISALIDRSPEIARTIERKIEPIKAWLNSMEAATDVLTDATSLGDAPAATVSVPDEGNGVLRIAPILIAQTVYVLVLALFLMSTRRAYHNRIIMLPSSREDRLRVARILNQTLSQVSSYLFVISMINIGVGVATTLLFLVAGIPNAVVWGFVFGLACFVPYLGPIAAIALCGLVHLVTFDTLAQALVAPAILLGINVVEANFVTPLLVSRRLEVSALAVFFTVALFTWLWGPVASIVAVPVLILFGAVARHVPSLRHWAIILMCENQQTFETRDSRRRFFAAEEALHAPDPALRRWWQRAPRPAASPPPAAVSVPVSVPDPVPAE
jgi:predicted PurR-regulated permease PerM